MSEADDSLLWLGRNQTNESSFEPASDSFTEPWKKKLDLAATVILTFNTITFMLGMGAAIYLKEVITHAKRPVGVFIGMLGQFLIMPLFGFLLSIAFGLKPYEALGVLMISCSPGGTFSNFFTYWLDGDLALSILMTTCSSVIAFGGMPLNLWIYSHYWIGGNGENDGGTGENDGIMILPYKSIISSLLFITIPCGIGMLTRHFHHKAAALITKISSIAGWIGVLAGLIVWLILYWKSFVLATPLIYLAALLLPLLGFIMAFTVAKITCQSYSVARTIGIETGCQNMPVAMSIILLSYTDPQIKGSAMLFPTLYGSLLIIEAIIGISSYQIAKKFVFARESEREREKENERESDCESELPMYRATVVEGEKVWKKERMR